MQQGLESSGGLGTEDTSKKPATALGTGRAKASKRLVLLLWMDAIRALSAGGLEGLHRVAGLLHCARHETSDRMLLPAHGMHDLGQRGAVLASQHGHHLGRLAARARCRGFRLGGRPLGPVRFLSGGGLVGRLALGRRGFGRLGATFGVAGALRLRRFRRLRRGGYGESLNALPDAGDGGLAILELPDRLDPGQAAPNRDEPLGRPRLRQFGEVRLAAKAVERGGGSGGGILRGGMRRDVVVGVNRKNRHYSFSFVPRAARSTHGSLRAGGKARQFCTKSNEGERTAMGRGRGARGEPSRGHELTVSPAI